MTKQPFFMRFVEKPTVEVQTDVKAGAEGDDKKKPKPKPKDWECMKYPSDGDEYPIEWP